MVTIESTHIYYIVKSSPQRRRNHNSLLILSNPPMGRRAPLLQDVRGVRLFLIFSVTCIDEKFINKENGPDDKN